MNSFADLLNRHLLERRMSQSRFAGLAGCDHSYISRLIAGARLPSAEMVDQICDALELDELERRNMQSAAWLGGSTISVALDYLLSAEHTVNANRPQDMQGGKDATRSYFMAMIVELGELLQELSWKPWKDDSAIDPDRVADEFADVLAFLGVITANVMAQTGLDTEDLARAFDRKTRTNVARAKGQVVGYAPAGGVQSRGTSV